MRKFGYPAMKGMVAVLFVLLAGRLIAAPVGVVGHVKVVSDKVADVSSMAAWQRSFIREGMTDEQKMIAAWKSSVAFVFQDAPPIEFLHEACVHDPIKSFNVYGYGMCCCASARIEAFARHLGLSARGQSINGHSVPEVEWGGRWHMLDASLANYFTLADGTIAGVDAICAAVQGFLSQHPELKGNAGKLSAFQRADGWTGWKRGPALLANCSFYDAGGWWPAHTHGWASTMQEFDGAHKTPVPFEYGYSQGYELNLQLRRGERIVRHWSNDGRHVNGVLKDGDAPGCLTMKVGEGDLKFLRGYGDLNDGRIGYGTLDYEVPLADGSFRLALVFSDNLACRAEDGRGAAVHAKDTAHPAWFEFVMPSSYVYLDGRLALEARAGGDAAVRIEFSDNNGLDWREVAVVNTAGSQEIDLSKRVFRRYGYRLRFTLTGRDAGLERLKLSHTFQCSQRALPSLDAGTNWIAFSAGPHTGTVTIEGATTGGKDGKQVTPMDFHPALSKVDPDHFSVQASGGSVTYEVRTPGDMTALRFGGFYRVRDARDAWAMEVSFDGGKTFRRVAEQTGPHQGICRYDEVRDVPAGTRVALVRWVGTVRNTTCMFSLRIDADYAHPAGGFAPVNVTYVWDEDGAEKRDVHVARSPDDVYAIVCAARPRMKSIALERAE